MNRDAWRFSSLVRDVCHVVWQPYGLNRPEFFTVHRQCYYLCMIKIYKPKSHRNTAVLMTRCEQFVWHFYLYHGQWSELIETDRQFLIGGLSDWKIPKFNRGDRQTLVTQGKIFLCTPLTWSTLYNRMSNQGILNSTRHQCITKCSARHK